MRWEPGPKKITIEKFYRSQDWCVNLKNKELKQELSNNCYLNMQLKKKLRSRQGFKNGNQQFAQAK